MNTSIQVGDNIELLKGYPDNYFDSVVTDCPYGLGKEPNAVKLLQDWIDHGYHEIKGKGFMGKKWDAFVPQPIFWKEVFRVLKPGGYVLAFFGTRTYDWGTLAIRMAGFEIRDMINWHYGEGFPKSMDISKQLDKMAGADRKIIGIGKAGKGFNKVKGFGVNTTQSDQFTSEWNTTEASTDLAKEWDGWGTALKPASEPICVARRPVEGTVAENVLKWGTGGINIDACRVGEKGARNNGSNADHDGFSSNKILGKFKATERIDYDKGRFPANVLFDPFMAAELDNQTGTLTSGKPCGKRKADNNIYGQYAKGQDITGFGDSGGASRFFYCAKTSQFERHAGCEGLGLKDPACVTDFRPSLKENPENWSNGTETPYTRTTQTLNNHPTVKPIALMRWLQRLVTPKGGITLDPFAGSGTSGCSSQFEDINIVLMEMEESYIPIIEARVKYWGVEQNRINYLNDIRVQKEEVSQNQLNLFSAPQNTPSPDSAKLNLFSL